ncbi:MAG: DUF167 family protein [Pyrodictiaceae archaeon]
MQLDNKVRQVLEELIAESNNRVYMTIYVKPGASEDKILLEAGDLVFYTKEHDEVRANASLIRVLSRLLNTPPSRIRIVYGKRSSPKRVEIIDVKREDIIDILANALK